MGNSPKPTRPSGPTNARIGFGHAKQYYFRMDASAWVGFGAALIAGIAAVIALVQARHAKTQAEAARIQADAAREQAVTAKEQALSAREQAEAAKAQVGLMQKQIDIAERANELTARSLAATIEGRSTKLEIRVSAKKIDNEIQLVVHIENNGGQSANIQIIAAVFGDGTSHTDGLLAGEAVRGSGRSQMPAELPVGRACSYQFAVFQSNAPSGTGGQVKMMGSTFVLTPDWTSQKWRGLDRIEVRANNQLFTVSGENAHWCQQIRYGYSPSQEPDPDLLPKG